jgi:hypothetical protein
MWRLKDDGWYPKIGDGLRPGAGLAQLCGWLLRVVAGEI